MKKLFVLVLTFTLFSDLAQITSCSKTFLAVAQTPIKAALVQFPIEGNKSRSEFLAKMEKYVVQAKSRGASLVVFPELFVLDTWPTQSKDSDAKISNGIAHEITPTLFKMAKELSKKHQISILAGSAPRFTPKGITNTSLLALPSGEEIYQDKIFLTHWEEEQGWLPGNVLRVFDTPWGRTAILICYDVEFPVLSHQLSAEHPELILVPSMTESENGLQRVRRSAQARAIEQYAYVLVAATVGKPNPSWIHFGKSAAFAPWDGPFSGILGEQEQGSSGITLIDLDVQKLTENRKTSHFYPAKKQIERKIKIMTDYKKNALK